MRSVVSLPRAVEPVARVATTAAPLAEKSDAAEHVAPALAPAATGGEAAATAATAAPAAPGPGEAAASKADKGAGDKAPQEAGEAAKGPRGKSATGAGAGEPADKQTAPSPRAAIAPAAAAVRQRAKGQRAHSTSPDIPVGSAQRAAVKPDREQTREAARATVAGIDDAGKKTEELKREEFKKKLQEAIDAKMGNPTTESQAKRVMKEGAREANATMRTQLESQRQVVATPMATAASAEVAAADMKAPDSGTLVEEPLGGAPKPVSAASVVPEALPAERLDYSSDRAPADQAMAEAGVTQETLEKGNDPAFGPTLKARSAAEDHEAKVEAQYRKSEATVQNRGRAMAKATLAEELGGMHGVRGGKIGTVVGAQTGTKGKDAAERQRITDTITGIKNDTKKEVDRVLTLMSSEAVTIFEMWLGFAEGAYEATFEEEKGGTWTWLTTWGDDWQELIESSLRKAKSAYLDLVGKGIDQVAALVEIRLKEARACVSAGLRKVEAFVKGLDAKLAEFGQEALAAVGEEFAALEQEIDDRRDQLVDALADQYKASYERMSAMEERLREANKSLWQRVYDATVGLIKKIIAFKDMLLSILAKAASVIVDIISDPIGFLGNLIDGVMQGLSNFRRNIEDHLKRGLMEWLFGELGESGLQLPENFDLKGIVSIVLQVLGLTYANIRARAVKIVGEPIVSALEETAEVFKVLISKGVSGLWEFIKDQVLDLKSMVLDAIFDYIKEKIIVAGITWVVSLLNPASAFFKACKAIYDIVMFVINKGSQIMAFVNAVIDSIAAIARGAVGVAAQMVEAALAKAIPLAIGFLASLLGLGDIGSRVRKVIDKAQKPVNKAIDWVINGAVKTVKAAGGLVKKVLGKDKPQEAVKEKPVPEAQNPETQARIEAGLLALRQTEAATAKDGRLTIEEAQQVASTVKKDHPVFQSIDVRAGQQHNWIYHWKANPESDAPGGDMEPMALTIERIEVEDDKLFAARHTSGAAFELGVSSTIIKNQTIPELEEEFDVPIDLLARGDKDFNKPSAQYLARAKAQRGHRAGGERRQPDVSVEIVGPGGKVRQVVVMEITLVDDFTPTRRDPVHKVDQFEHTVKLLLDKYGRDVPIRFMFFVPEPPSLETEQFMLDALKAEGASNIEVVWKVVAVSRKPAKSA
jgi:hypothetical protein